VRGQRRAAVQGPRKQARRGRSAGVNVGRVRGGGRRRCYFSGASHRDQHMHGTTCASGHASIVSLRLLSRGFCGPFLRRRFLRPFRLPIDAFLPVLRAAALFASVAPRIRRPPEHRITASSTEPTFTLHPSTSAASEYRIAALFPPE
jgi:hypothetical protein